MKQDARVGREVGGKVTLYRTYYSHPRYTNYTWSRGGQTLATTRVSDTTIQLNIYGVVVEDRGYNFTLDIGQFDRDRDTGRYSLRVCNPVGCDISTVELSVARPPDEPTQFKVIDNETTSSVWLTWTPAFDGGYPQEFVLEYRKFGSTTWNVFSTYRDTGKVFVVEVNSLAPGETYVFRLHARNAKYDPSRTAFVFLEAKTIGGSASGER
ncbi:myosin-binding protein C, fast-type-like [Haliotis cracherodii]|uniref:myosin-binding protein C, fast-type-like n=1 Tax=Haliotis cracherodii TaxID=6455 RepID=UPI0039E7EFA0